MLRFDPSLPRNLGSVLRDELSVPAFPESLSTYYYNYSRGVKGCSYYLLDMLRILKPVDLVSNSEQIFERTMAGIKQMDVPRYLEDPDDILEAFEFVYELEFKYNRLLSNRFLGVPDRRDNMLEIIERKAHEVIPPLAETFIDVFDNWLRHHAITSPQLWAEMRVEALEELWGGYLDSEYIQQPMETFLGELSRYLNYDLSQNIIAGLEASDLIRDEFYEYAFTFTKEMMEVDLEDVAAGYMEMEDFQYRYSEFEAIEDAETVEELTKAVEGLDFRSIPEEDIELDSIIDQMDDMGVAEFMQHFLNHTGISVEALLEELYREVLFPAWFGHWKPKGIEKTRDTIEKISEQLHNIQKFPIRMQFAVLNIAKNANHQNGSMMEYYEEMWGVDYVALKRLSNLDTTQWEKELSDIGVMI